MSAFQLPQPLSTHDVQVDDETVIVLRQHGNTAGPRLVLSHGIGFAIDMYYPFWSLLLEKFELIIYDLRNHGCWNKVSALANHHVPAMVSDHDIINSAIDRHYGAKPKVGIFHSIGGVISLLSPSKGNAFVARALFDPPVCKPGRDLKTFEQTMKWQAAVLLRRRKFFQTRAEFIDKTRPDPRFRHVVAGTVELLAMTTLRARDGGYEFCCPNEYEAQMVTYAGVYAEMVDLAVQLTPVKVIGADPTVPFSYLPSFDLSDITTVNYDFLPETTHLLQLEKPQECIAMLQAFLREISFID